MHASHLTMLDRSIFQSSVNLFFEADNHRNVTGGIEKSLHLKSSNCNSLSFLYNPVQISKISQTLGEILTSPS